jgi:GT2 family glycosyltransferase
VLATLDRSELIGDCLTALVADLEAGDELIVIDAGQGATAAELLTTATGGSAVEGRYLTSAVGKSRQLNVGARTAVGDVLLFTDDDVRVPSGWRAGMVAAFDDPTVGIAFGHVVGLSRVPGSTASPAPSPGEAPEPTFTYAHGAAMAMRTSALRDVGGFDERLGPGAPAYGEEHDVLLRLRERGWRAVIADAPAAEHLEWRDDEDNRRTALVYERGAGAFIGSAVRRRPRSGARHLAWRLRYLRQYWWQPGLRRFAARGTVAFVGGLAYGLRLRPRRFLDDR